MASAQSGSCVVKNGNGASVVLNVEDFEEDGTVSISVSSDCKDMVNVSFQLNYTVGVKGKSFYDFEKTSRVYTFLVDPNRTNIETVTIKPIPGNIIKSINEIIVSGARCE